MGKIDYRFEHPNLKQLNKDYIVHLNQINRINDGAKLMELKDIGQSIDF
jgi:hypothetical protein